MVNEGGGCQEDTDVSGLSSSVVNDAIDRYNSWKRSGLGWRERTKVRF